MAVELQVVPANIPTIEVNFAQATAITNAPLVTATGNLLSGQPLMISATGALVANDGTRPIAGFAPVGGAVAGQQFIAQPRDTVRVSASTFTAGTKYYMSPTGAVTTTASGFFIGTAIDPFTLVYNVANDPLIDAATKLKKDGSDFGATGQIQVFALGVRVGGSLRIVEGGVDSVHIGKLAGNTNTTVDNIAIGRNAGNASTKVGIAVGPDALSTNTGDNAVAVGFNALATNTGAQSSAFGYGAGSSNTGANLSAVGSLAGNGNTGVDATFLGAGAGFTNTKNNVTAIGAGARCTLDNEVRLGNLTVVNLTTSATAVKFGDLPIFATDAAADAAVAVGQLYRLTGSRVVYQRPT